MAGRSAQRPLAARPGKARRAHLYAFIDDHSRLLLHGRFSFKGDLPALELVLRRALQRWGVPRRAYYDNAQVFRSHHMRILCAELDIHRVFTRRYRPMGHGKVEAFNRYCTGAFIAEVKASRIETLDQLNEAFLAWVDGDYNRRRHSQLGCSPLERWQREADQVRWVDEDKLKQAFLWREKRTPDASGVFRLFSVAYQTGSDLARRRIEVRYDPDWLDEVEVWIDGQFRERVRPLEILTHRRARAPQPPPVEPLAQTDWLGHLVRTRRGRIPKPQTPDHRTKLIEVFTSRLHPDVVDPDGICAFDQRYGPFDPLWVERALDDLLATEPNDQHLEVYLEALRRGRS